MNFCKCYNLKNYFFYYYTLRDKNLLVDFLLRQNSQSALDRLLNLYLRLWNQHEPDNNFHILADTPPKFV